MQEFFEHFKLLSQKRGFALSESLSPEAVIRFLSAQGETIALLVGKREFFCLHDFISKTNLPWKAVDSAPMPFKGKVYISSFLYHQKEILCQSQGQLYTVCQSRLTALVELKSFEVFQSHVFSWPKKQESHRYALLTQRVIERIEKNIELPPLPQTTKKLLALKNHSLPNLQSFLEIVEQDPILLAQVIKWARSPFYGMRSDVATAQEAVTRVLGLDIAMNLSLSLCLKKPFFWPEEDHLGYQKLHERSLLLSEMSLAIAKELQLPLDEHYLMLGALLADFGYYVLAHCFSPYYKLLVQENSLNLQLDPCLQEFHLLDFSHQHIGAWVLSKWHFPLEVLSIVQWHHHAQAPIVHHLYPKTVLFARYLLSRQALSDEYKTQKELASLTNFFGPFDRWEGAVEKLFSEKENKFNKLPLLSQHPEFPAKRL